MNNKSKSTGWALALGAGLGAAAGVAAGHIGVWLAIGVAIGVAVGAAFGRREAKCPECSAVYRANQAEKEGNKLGASS
jgi:hypothetical protein